VNESWRESNISGAEQIDGQPSSAPPEREEVTEEVAKPKKEEEKKKPLIEKKKVTIMETPCKHKYHVSCLTPWMNIKLECPTCRARLPPLE
jgi:hypothetical protein